MKNETTVKGTQLKSNWIDNMPVDDDIFVVATTLIL